MFDLIFLIIMVVTMVMAFKGKYSETLGNFGFVIGLAAAVIGIVSEFISRNANGTMVILNILVLIIAFGLKPVSRLLVKIYSDKMEAREQKIRDMEERCSKGERAIFTEENFNDPNLRFNGEYKDFKP